MAHIKPGTRTQPNANGTYEGLVQMFNAQKGVWVSKKNITLFFPSDWSMARMEFEISEAFKQGLPQTRFVAKAPSGICIQFSWDAKNQRTTFYPLCKS